jgi:rhamnogalacturonyl hydrolase YesR
MPDTDHLFYKNGYAGVGLLEAYRHIPEPRILDAVRRAADWTAVKPVSSNNNYNSFACWILTAYYGDDPDPRYLEAAVGKTVQGVLPRQLQNGGWAGHNSWVYYQGIIVSGLAALLSILPLGHPQYEAIERCCKMAINNLALRQNEEGYLLATFDPQERAEAERREIGYEKASEYLADSYAMLGLLWTSDMLGYEVEQLLSGLMQACVHHMRQHGPESNPGAHGADAMVLGYAWRWLARREG